MKKIYLTPEGSKKAIENLDYFGGVNRWYAPFKNIQTTSNVAHPGIGYRFTPFIVTQKIEIDGVGYAQSTQTTSGVSKIILYNSNEIYKPTTKIIETADFTNNANGSRQISIAPTILNAGVYFFAQVGNNTTNFNITTINATFQPNIFGDVSITNARLARKGWVYSTTYVTGSSAIDDFTPFHGDLTTPTINNILWFMKVITLF
ncbi:hypothetical protein [Nostoc phage N1]|nr:hypothetical protein [Nostoc phage N1]